MAEMSAPSPTPSGASTDAMSPKLVIVFLSTEGFGAAMSQAQLTPTALLLAFGVSQLFWGPLSDRFGRSCQTSQTCRAGAWR